MLMPKKLLAIITAFFILLFGKISWNTPPWVKYLGKKASARPLVFWTKVIGIIVFAAALTYVYHWYKHRPQPEQVTAQVNVPLVTPLEKVLVPSVLSVDFGVTGSGGEFNARSVAPLNMLGKEVPQGITISPAMPGKWIWQSDSHLEFTPANDWPSGQTYTINFSKDSFTKGSRMASLSYSFTTLPFSPQISEFKFYQDPVNPKLREAVATVSFNFPVDTHSLENRISLAWQSLPNQPNQDFKYSISYDENKRTAYIHSEPLPLPQVERFLVLTLDKGIKPVAGPSESTENVTDKVLIPDASSYLKVSNVSTAIVRNQQSKPEQVLTLETTLGVTEAELGKSFHAYVLPQDYPATAAEEAKPNYQWQDPGEVTAAILSLAKPLDLQAIPADRDYATLHSYKYTAKTPSYIYIKLDKGTNGFGDYVLANDYTAILSVPEFPQEISFLHKGSLLALGTEEKLSVLVRGLSAVKFNIARVLPDAINNLVTQTAGDFDNPYFINSSFNQDNISEISTEIQPFDASDPAKAQYTAIDFNKYLTAHTSGGPLGLFLLQADGWDPKLNTALSVQNSRLILITDMGLLVKDNTDLTHDIYVQSISAGTPVANAGVSILGKNGLPLLTRMTDASGHVSFPSLKAYTNEREPTVYLVRNGNDVSFIPYARQDRQLNYSRFDIGGVSYSNDQTALTAYVFSDRGIYRPGDTTHIGMIVKQPYVAPQPVGLPLEATVIDPRGVTIKDVKLTTNDSGYLTLDFQTNAASPTGQYNVNLYIVKDNHPSNLIGSTSVQVAEFLPDRMRITEHFSAETSKGWISPAGLMANVGLWNLYGAPAANHRVGAKILLTPHAVTFKEYPDFTFIDPLLNPKAPPKVFTDTLPDTQTNDQGQAQFDLKLDRFAKATYELTVFAEGFEAEGGRSVTTQTTALVSPLDYLVGYKPDADLSFIKQNETRSLHFIAVNPQLKQQALADLTLQVFNLHPVTTLVKKDDGTYEYQSIVQSTQISSNPFSISEQGIDYALATQNIGDYLITIIDKNGTELSRLKYSVVGSTQLPLPKNAELNVKLNKSEFTPGETIQMQVTAPYTGAGLITIERDKVYASQWFKATTTASVQTIQVPKDFQGDGYVNIAFVRDLNSPEIYMSPLSYSVMPFSVTHENHVINVDLSTPTLARPGQSFQMTYKTDKPSKIIVYAVDEGILQVAQYVSPDPLKFFFQKHALEVTTQQIVDQILPKFVSERELSAAGGDSGGALLRKNLNPFKRKTEAPVVYWSGIVDADTTPRTLTYQVPDYFNGTLRIMAVAAAVDAVGAKTNSAEVRGYFVINPNVPTFVAPGDEFDVTASIANNVEGSGANANVTVNINASPQLEIVGTARQSLVIPEGQERSVRVKVRAKAELGSADITLIATLGDKTSKMASSLSIRPASAYATTVTSGYATDTDKSLPLNRVLYPEYRNVEAAVSVSPLILVTGLTNYLQDYPYGCVEQLVSKGLPWLVMANQPWFAQDITSINAKVQQTIQMLMQRQMSNGGFSYWPSAGMNSGNDFASVYAMHFLTEAKAQGYSVPSDVFSAGIGFLKELATQDVSNMDQARIHAYAIYVLTRNEIVTTNYLTNLQLTLDKMPDQPWHKDITSAYIAATYQMLKSSADANKIIAYYQPHSGAVSDATDFNDPNTTDAQYLYLLARHFPERLKQVDNSLLMSVVDSLNANSMSTVLAGYSSLALSAYGEFYPLPANAQISLSETLSNDKQDSLSAANGMYQTVKLNLDAKQININNPSKSGYFYQLTQAGFDRELPKQPVNQHIEVYREYLDANNTAVTSVKPGDEVYVHIRARSTDNQYHSNIALVDLLPGGFEVVRESVKNDNVDYVDMREDRVIFFTSLGPDSIELIYRIKATNAGKYIVPPISAGAMYNPGITSTGVAGNIVVGE